MSGGSGEKRNVTGKARFSVDRGTDLGLCRIGPPGNPEGLIEVLFGPRKPCHCLLSALSNHHTKKGPDFSGPSSIRMRAKITCPNPDRR